MSVPEYPRKRQMPHRSPTRRHGRKAERSPFVTMAARCLLAFVLTLGLLPLPALAEELQSDSETAAELASVEVASVEQNGSGVSSPDFANAEPDSTQATLPDDETPPPPDEEEPPSDCLNSEGSPSQDGAKSRSGVTGEAAVLDQGDFGADNSLHWVYKDDASLTISGNGAMPDYTEDGGQPWAKYFALIESVVIEDGITAVGDYSFYEARIIYSVELPDTLESIGSYAFAKISYLLAGVPGKWDLTIPDSVTSIGDHAFYGCSNLYSCKLPDSMKELPESIFEFCEDLSAQFPSNLEIVGARAFKDARGEITQTIPNSVRVIGDEAFSGTQWGVDLVVPGSLQSCGKGAFSFVSLRHDEGKLVLGEGLTESVVKGSFNSVGIVQAIALPASFTTIGSDVLPSANLFYEVADGNPNFCAIDGVLFGRKSLTGTVYDSKNAVLIKMPQYQKGSYTVPPSTKEISQDALSWYLTSLTLPASLTSLRDSLNNVSITEINVDADNPVFKSIDGILYSKDGSELIKCPFMKALGDNFAVPDGVVRLAANAFYRSQLHGITLPKGLTAIGSGCFDRCNTLSCVYLPRSVSTVSANSFIYGTSNVRGGFTVFYEGTQDEWNKASYGKCAGLANAEKVFSCKAGGQTKDALLFCISHDGVLSVLRDSLRKEFQTFVNDYEEGTQEWAAYSNSITSVVVGEYVTEVGANTFSGLVNVDHVLLPSEMEKVAGNAFATCPKLKDVECLGLPFDAQDASGDSPSFPANACVHYKSDYAQQWLADACYDATQGTWHGYVVAEDESLGLPVIGRIQLDRTAMRAKGADQDYYDTDIWTGYAVYDTKGNDITNYVTVAVQDPERTVGVLSPTKTRPYQDFWPAKDHMQHSDVDDREHVIHFPRAGVAGDYVVTATPHPGKVAGTPIAQTVPLTRNKEIIYGADLHNWELYGKATTFLAEQRPFDVYNQYGETVLDRVSVKIKEQLTGEYLENGNNKYGFYVEPCDQFKIRRDHMAPPGDFTMEITSNDVNLLGTKSIGFKTYRSGLFINQPFTMTLSGGEKEITVQDAGQWTNSPYRVRVYDCYDDPIWPEVTWHISDTGGVDVTSSFIIDEQGYLQIGQDVFDMLSADRPTVFSVKVSTPGVKSSTTLQGELGGDDSYTGPWSNALSIELESNELTLSLRREQPPAPITHTATFVVGDDVIGEVTFAEGDTSLDEPVLPARDNYVGSWKEYDLASATADITVQGVYEPINPDAVSEIEVGAKASYENGAVAIRLSAMAPTRQVKVESSTTKPIDVVLVCDQSGSMTDTLTKGGQTKQQALIECASQFVNRLYDNALKTGTDHRVALVGFAYSNYREGNDYNKKRYENTGLLATTDGVRFAKFDTLTESDYAKALMPIAVNGAMNDNVTRGIKSIGADGATAADVGLTMARNIFSESQASLGGNGVARERIVVLITDGVPTRWTSTKEHIEGTAADAISIAKAIKQSQGAKIYSIGVDADASPSTPFTIASNGITTKGSTLTYDFNRFLHVVSSNYPSASSMSKRGEGSQDSGYYMAVNKTDELSKIFSSILYSTVYSIESFSSATLTYTLPENFVLTTKQEEQMRAELATQGISDDDIVVDTCDGKTTITFKKVKVTPQVVDGERRFVASVSFQVSATQAASGTVDSGAASAISGGEVIDIEMPPVAIPDDRCVLVFKVNDTVYEIRDGAMGDPIALPDTDVARWLDLERQVEAGSAVVNSSYAVFKATTLERVYTVRWELDGQVVVEHHEPGAELTVPASLLACIPEGMELAGWEPSCPATMPGRNISCSAVLTPKHVHDYSAQSYAKGDCTVGMTRYDVCACGAVQETPLPAQAQHEYQAYMKKDSSGQQTTVEKLVCDVCGCSVDKNVTYKVAEVSSSPWGSLFGKATILDLNKYDCQIVQPGESSDVLEMRLYIGESDKSYRVERIDENNIHTSYVTTLVDGYLIFSPDHFSIYVIGELDESGHSTVESLSYSDCTNAISKAELPLGEPGANPNEYFQWKPDDEDFGDINGEATANPSNPGNQLGGNSDGNGSNGQQNGGQGGNGSSTQPGNQQGGAQNGGSQMSNGGGQPAGSGQESGGSQNGGGSGSADDSAGGAPSSDSGKSPSRTKIDARTALSQTGDSAHMAVAACGLFALAALVLLIVARRLASTRKRL